jgi:hypothetical protein
VSKRTISAGFSVAERKIKLQKNIFFGYWLLGKKIVNLQPVLK